MSGLSVKSGIDERKYLDLSQAIELLGNSYKKIEGERDTLLLKNKTLEEKVLEYKIKLDNIIFYEVKKGNEVIGRLGKRVNKLINAYSYLKKDGNNIETIVNSNKTNSELHLNGKKIQELNNRIKKLELLEKSLNKLVKNNSSIFPEGENIFKIIEKLISDNTGFGTEIFKLSLDIQKLTNEYGTNIQKKNDKIEELRDINRVDKEELTQKNNELKEKEKRIRELEMQLKEEQIKPKISTIEIELQKFTHYQNLLTKFKILEKCLDKLKSIDVIHLHNLKSKIYDEIVLYFRKNGDVLLGKENLPLEITELSDALTYFGMTPFNAMTIKKQYRRIMKELHSDLTGDNSNDDKVSQLNDAYELIKKAIKDKEI